MVGVVLVSHSPRIAEGIRDLALEMAGDYKGLHTAAGLEDGTIGTDAVRIMDAIEDADTGDGVVVLADLGSGIISAEMAIDMLSDGVTARIADAPIVEGAIVAVVEASGGSTLEQVIAETEKTRGIKKIQ